MKDLDAASFDRINDEFTRAREALSDGDKATAINNAERAWSILPEPKFDWDVSKVVTQMFASVYRDAGRYDDAIGVMDALFASNTVKPHQDGPRFVIATIYLEKGDLDEAMKWFKEADQISRGRCFRGTDRKYQDFYKSRLRK